jgi:exopolyphosphatase / guanosine-5'-triphosphate,3'-diphosphate pyrophosphatase
MTRRAAIDIGTVTSRLLVADVDGRTVGEVVRRAVITHLGSGMAETGSLTEEAMSRTVEAVAGFVREAREAGAEAIVCAATSASRDAANSDEFAGRLAALGVEPKVISGDREAMLAFIGATYALDAEDVLVADLGGGSTELVLGTADTVEGGERVVTVDAARSIDVGSRRLTDRFLGTDPPRPSELRDAAEWAVAEFRPFFDGLRDRPRSMVSLAGTATQLSALQQGLLDYDADRVHGSVLTGADLAMLKEDLAGLPLARRREVPGMHPERAEVIVAGALILEVLLGLAGLDSTTVSEHDILYGLVLEGA